MNLDELFAWLKRLAKALQPMIGANCEIVLHDLRDPEHSVIAIEGNLSGRKPGAPLPDVHFLQDGSLESQQDQLNYLIQIGRKTFHSSTVWIRDHAGKAVGALCINMDYSKLEEMQSLLNTMLEPLQAEPQFVVQDSLATDVPDLIAKAIQSMLGNDRLSRWAELPAFRKKAIVYALEQNGIFRLRGAVEEVCDLLQISRGSVYNYRKG